MCRRLVQRRCEVCVMTYDLGFVWKRAKQRHTQHIHIKDVVKLLVIRQTADEFALTEKVVSLNGLISRPLFMFNQVVLVLTSGADSHVGHLKIWLLVLIIWRCKPFHMALQYNSILSTSELVLSLIASKKNPNQFWRQIWFTLTLYDPEDFTIGQWAGKDVDDGIGKTPYKCFYRCLLSCNSQSFNRFKVESSQSKWEVNPLLLHLLALRR